MTGNLVFVIGDVQGTKHCTACPEFRISKEFLIAYLVEWFPGFILPVELFSPKIMMEVQSKTTLPRQVVLTIRTALRSTGHCVATYYLKLRHICVVNIGNL
jgi:hypothetical protein